MRRLAATILLSALTAASAAAVASAASAEDDGLRVVEVAEVFGVLDPQLAGFVLDRIDAANRDEAELLVLEVDSPGALGVAPEQIVRRIRSSRVPIAVWVGPRRARARSAGALLVAAAHVSAIGPSARLGPLRPTELSVDPSTGEGMLHGRLDAALASMLARERGRGDTEVFFDRSLGANASLDAGAVDLVVPSVKEVLERSDGRTVATAAGDVTLRLKTDEVVLRFHKPGPIRGVLHSFTSPSLVYLLLVTAAMLIAFELFQPGFGVAGVTGAVLLAGAIYGLVVLPIGVLGSALAAAGLALLGADVAVHGLGIPTLAGLVLFTYGSLTMFPAPAGALGIRWWLVLLGVAAAAVFFVPVMTVVRRARPSPEQQREARSLVGQPGQVRSMLNPEGFVWVADELWRARSEDGARLGAGEDVLVTGTEGILLRVRRR